MPYTAPFQQSHSLSGCHLLNIGLNGPSWLSCTAPPPFSKKTELRLSPVYFQTLPLKIETGVEKPYNAEQILFANEDRKPSRPNTHATGDRISGRKKLQNSKALQTTRKATKQNWECSGVIQGEHGADIEQASIIQLPTAEPVAPKFDQIKQDPIEIEAQKSWYEPEEEDGSDGQGFYQEPASPQSKTALPQKNSGEPLRTALRPSCPIIRQSCTLNTSTHSKSVHFDSHLEIVRHFLKFDCPSAVSVDSSPVSLYDDENEFRGDKNYYGHSIPSQWEISMSDLPTEGPFEWEIDSSNLPTESAQRLSMPVRIEKLFLSEDSKMLIGSVVVANLAFQKDVIARFTFDDWTTVSEVFAEYSNKCYEKVPSGFDRFKFRLELPDSVNLEIMTMFFCIKYIVNTWEVWDNNNGNNFQINFRKKAKSHNNRKVRVDHDAPAGSPRSENWDRQFPELDGRKFSDRYNIGASLTEAIQCVDLNNSNK